MGSPACRSCGAANRPEARFCRECGSALGVSCPACGSVVEAGQRFCDECGSSLEGARPSRAEPLAERRVVSVLFADLVGFTALSENRDAEEVRELLSRYFDACRRLVARYGGTIEKFIGDAAMAVWGAPAANEDDAERAVRTGLDLVAAVAGLADELGVPTLRLRAGVLTGEAAVTLGAEGQGMVAGDLVNTAARIQALAEPGTVLVGESTRRASEAAIAYEDLGPRELRGKSEAAHVYRALRVIAARRGEGRAQGLEAPFVGRDREIRLVQDLFHAGVDERRARLVSVIGTAGSGKSRLSWEFEKHVDGLAFDVRWHRGRCLAYGEGVAFWALAEMVRVRARIAEEDSPEVALAKLDESLAGLVATPDERDFLQPRLAHLLGLAERSAPDKEDLFSAWRLFFERMAEHDPVVLVFEDLQWADDGLLDFIEYLLDWSRAFPIYVLTLARPELSERRTTWGAGRRDFTSLFLDPLSSEDMTALLAGLVPGLPDELAARIVARSEGIPLYAVETVRMLLDRGLLVRDGDAYRASEPIDTLAVPETLHALAAARLDALESEERRLLEDAAVLGKTFSREGLAALADLPPDALERLVQSLVRKEILTVQMDPFSPERGQLSFVQDLLRQVAYETLSLRERKTRHLAAAAHLSRTGAEEEIAAVLAAHYLDAYRIDPDAGDAGELRRSAHEALQRAAERAISLAAAGEAAHYFAQAAELSETPQDRADLLERGGRAASQHGDGQRALALLEEAQSLLEGLGDEHGAARVSARRAEVIRWDGEVVDAFELMHAAYESLSRGAPDRDLALVASQLARYAYFVGKGDEATEWVETALDLAEALDYPEALAEALNAKATILWRRPHESGALLREAVRVALDHDLTGTGLRAQFNLSGLAIEHDRLEEARAILEDALALARRRGDRLYEAMVLGQISEVLFDLGDWDAAWECTERSDVDDAVSTVAMLKLPQRVRIAIERGDPAEARRVLDRGELGRSSDLQDKATEAVCASYVLRAEGRTREAFEAAYSSLPDWRVLRQFHYYAGALAQAADAALELGEVELVEQFVRDAAAAPMIEWRPRLNAELARMRAKLAARDGGGAGEAFTEAAAAFDALRMPVYRATVQVEQAEWLAGAGEPEAARALAAQAREPLARVGAARWLERADALGELAPAK